MLAAEFAAERTRPPAHWMEPTATAAGLRGPVLIRHATPADYEVIIAVLNDWWGGRRMADMVPRLFFIHFRDTSFVAEEDGEVVGFLTGFLSQANGDEAYIHFAGVRPDHRGRGIARALYERFFDAAAENGRKVIRCVTSSVNTESVSFHKHLGFAIEPGDTSVGGVDVHRAYDGPGEDRVVFVRRLKPK
jgi:GNAT superfamily N-acetyltransferase